MNTQRLADQLHALLFLTCMEFKTFPGYGFTVTATDQGYVLVAFVGMDLADEYILTDYRMCLECELHQYAYSYQTFNNTVYHVRSN